MSIDDDEYESRDHSMNDNEFRSMYTLDIRRTLIGFIPNILCIGALFYFIFIGVDIISKFEDPGLAIMGLLIMSFSMVSIFPKLILYRLMYKKREEVQINFEGQLKAPSNVEYDK